MNDKEISALSTQTAADIAATIAKAGRAIDEAGTDILREYIQTCLGNWQRGEEISLEACSQWVTEIFTRRRNETQTELEAFNAMMIFGANFPAFVRDNQNQTEA